MIKALIIDDEPLACDLITEFLEKFPGVEIAGRCHDGFAGMKAIHELQPDLIFLDIQMPKISGFELLELLENPPAVIFTTAFDTFAIKAFEANAIDYLLKPFSEERFKQAMTKFLNSAERQPANLDSLKTGASQTLKDQNRIVIRDGGRIRILPLMEVFRLEADGDYAKIITAQGKFMKKQSLQHYENTLLSGTFLRVHRSHLVNISQITRIEPFEKNSHLAILKNGEKIPVSRTGYQTLRKMLDV